MADFGGVSTFPGAGGQYACQKPPPRHLPSDIENWLLEVRKCFPEYEAPIFTTKFGNWLEQITGINTTNSPLFAGNLSYEQAVHSSIGATLPSPMPKKCRRGIMPHAPIGPEKPVNDIEAVEMVPLEIGNKEKLEAYYESSFRAFRQLKRLDILDEIYKVRRGEASYERGEADATAVVYVLDRYTTTDEDPYEIVGATGTAHDPTYHLTGRNWKRENGAHDIVPQMLPSSIISSIEGMPVSHTQPSFATHSSSKQERDIEAWNTGYRTPPPSISSSIEGTSVSHAQPSSGEYRGIEDQRSSHFLPCMGVESSPPSVGTAGIPWWLPSAEPTYLGHLEFYNSMKSLDGMDQKFTLGHPYHTAWNPRNLSPEYAPQVYMNTQGTVDS
ncbi:hypothetical protein H112_00629 [Trichophyton rubrum D6]|uniref:Uncharacterized protein n=2 Tax=Trichophyton TaxID=5550 RepID=A0A022WG16_TRIRU|nr:hypothetical protein H100_00629 [Trichophyton rubrum MR850]EZF46374.1 hypothetical protein H102_00626 [Trichophyton rubrum CBS 100081]EZF57066.1 hypothetical protein H103_00628 [Trichophyton rubrum CBS 288.86]EZF67629.1 hypothetical protein H104_00615 [Trichophyton rubrum CBS 289.86]EZF78337.1 hypothetical protein H105_00624 [Trichophyton soudanense CBS 452.61]EZF88929.1 hypothetical protein H110_00633 [Trichophyton rubrum MR1448]EZG21301.1 hypothetical protein H107_00673 [Trichophyton rub